METLPSEQFHALPIIINDMLEGKCFLRIMRRNRSLQMVFSMIFLIKGYIIDTAIFTYVQFVNTCLMALPLPSLAKQMIGGLYFHNDHILKPLSRYVNTYNDHLCNPVLSSILQPSKSSAVWQCYAGNEYCTTWFI